jgi:hypothetical protein
MTLLLEGLIIWMRPEVFMAMKIWIVVLWVEAVIWYGFQVFQNHLLPPSSEKRLQAVVSTKMLAMT